MYKNLIKVKRIKIINKSTPILIAAGNEDCGYPVKEFAKMSEKLGGELRIFDGLPHEIMLAPKNNIVSSFICEWLKTASFNT